MLPKPGPAHAVFTDTAGTWDARVESFMVPGGPPSISSGVETDRVGCGGLCLITDYSLTRAATGELTWTAPAVLSDGTVPTWV